jgi:hypothetical protein
MSTTARLKLWRAVLAARTPLNSTTKRDCTCSTRFVARSRASIRIFGERSIIARSTQGLDNLAFDSEDRLLVSSYSDKFIVELVQEGDCAGEGLCGEFRTVSPGGLGLSMGIAVVHEPGRRETIVVADAYTLRQFQAQSGKDQDVTRWFPGLPPALPVTVAWDDSNLVLPSWPGGVVQVWDPRRRGGHRAARFRCGDVAVAEDLAIGAEGPASLPPTWGFNGIAVGRGGWIYATSDIDGDVYRIRPRRSHM